VGYGTAAWPQPFPRPAGGIGFDITQAIQEFQFNVMMTYVLMVMVLAIGLDLLSAWLRARIAR
jgi:ABC-type phosphate/phosphonate transport system permease subunit